jgi:hypothetical protein
MRIAYTGELNSNFHKQLKQPPRSVTYLARTKLPQAPYQAHDIRLSLHPQVCVCLVPTRSPFHTCSSVLYRWLYIKNMIKPFSASGDSLESMLNRPFHFLALYKGHT